MRYDFYAKISQLLGSAPLNDILQKMTSKRHPDMMHELSYTLVAPVIHVEIPVWYARRLSCTGETCAALLCHILTFYISFDIILCQKLSRFNLILSQI